MAGLDRLLAKSLDSVIRENLGDKTIRRIEERLFEKYGISLTQSIEQFQKLDAVLREFFGAGADGLEQRFLKNVCEIKVTNSESWIVIENPMLTKIILESFGDDDKKKILATLNGESMIISQIIERCNIPQTSGYRKVNALINDGLLLAAGYVTTPDGKKVTKYRSIFDNLKIDIIKNKISVTLHLPKDDLYNSSILAVCSAS
ncbi:MAG: transcriptional regulator [Candidatus Nitrosotenuis sp.]